jgi:hypothetical protein
MHMQTNINITHRKDCVLSSVMATIYACSYFHNTIGRNKKLKVLLFDCLLYNSIKFWKYKMIMLFRHHILPQLSILFSNILKTNIIVQITYIK